MFLFVFFHLAWKLGGRAVNTGLRICRDVEPIFAKLPNQTSPSLIDYGSQDSILRLVEITSSLL